jgi:hypothetical protein
MWNTARSLLVNPPSLKTGWVNRFVVTIGTVIPVDSSAAEILPIARRRSPSEQPKGNRSSSSS